MLELIDTRTVQKRLGNVSRSTIVRLKNAGQLHAVHVRGRALFVDAEVEALQRRLAVEAGVDLEFLAPLRAPEGAP
jgi:hypothetical protein